MFTQITWGSYITMVVIFLACYYPVIVYLFYRDDILQLITGGKIIQPGRVFEKQKDLQLVQSLSDEIRAFASQAAGSNLSREVVMSAFRLLLGKYPALKDSTFRGSIENLIVTESELNLSIHLEAGEAGALWV